MKLVINASAHLAIGVAAFFVVAYFKDSSGPEDLVPPTRSSERGRPSAGDRPRAAGEIVTTRMKAADYRAAWEAVPARRWTKAERLDFQTRLLKEWAATDLEGALAAAFSETWSRGNTRTVGESFAFQRAFSEVFVDRSEDILKLIQQRKTGVLESSLLLQAWSSTLLAKDRDLYLGYLRGMDGDDFAKSLGVAAGGAKDKRFLASLLDLMSAKESGGMTLEGLDPSFSKAVGEQLSKSELLAKLDSTGKALSGFYLSILAAKYSDVSRGASAEQVSAEIASFPEGQRDEFSKALLGTYTSSPAVLQTALDHLVTTGQWQLLDKDETSRAVQIIRQHADPVKLAEWAVDLPPREETTEMFHRGVEPYIRKSPDEAWSWIQEMAHGYWRDRALAEYSQVNLHVFNNPGKSAEAIAQIRDPAFLVTVKGWRSSWEKQQQK